MDIKNVQKSKNLVYSRVSKSSKNSSEKKKRSLEKSITIKENKNTMNKSEKKPKYSYGVIDKIVE